MKDKIKLAPVVGHQESKQGAYNAKYHLSEWIFNQTVVAMVQAHLEDHIEPIHVLRDNVPNGYGLLPAKINALNPDYIIEFHCNAAGSAKAKGNTVLFYSKSEKSKEFAEILNNTLFNVLRIEKDPLMALESKEDRGFNILKKTKAPCVILEPAFFSNEEDCDNMMKKVGEMTKGLANALNDFLKVKLDEMNKQKGR